MKITLKAIGYYIQGTIRYKLFYSPWGIELIRNHILEQILSRIISMDKECFNSGQCTMCGCKTTALQMCNKPCSKPCYPAMVGKKEWEAIKHKDCYVDNSLNIWEIKVTGEGVIFKLTNNELESTCN